MQLQILGGLDLTSASGEPAPDVTRQTRHMLACLALAGPKGLTRGELCALFWPDRPSALARNSLRQALVAIKKALSGGANAMLLHSDLEVVRLSAGAGTIDVHAFRHGVQGSRDGLIAAANAYRGELLSGVEVPDDVEQFVTSHRRSLSDQAQVLAERLSKHDDADDEMLDCAQALAGRLLQSNPASEEAHRALMRIHLRRGRTNAALRQFAQCKEALRRELRTEPDVESRRLFNSIQSSDSDEGALPADRPAVANGAGVYPSIAIMPFDNLGDAPDAYFADGVVEEITSTLSRIRDFFVIARQSTFTFKGRFVDVREVGRELGAAYVVEGTVRRGGDRLRISVQLVDAVTRAQLWSDRYEGAATEIFAFQDQIAAQVAGALKPAIRHAEIEAAQRKPPTSLKAYDQVMRAFPKLWGQNASAINEAIPILRDALRIDPQYGRAHALLAWCHALNATYLWTADPECDIEAARRAVDATKGLIDDDPTALTAAGAATGFCGDQEGASVLLEQALALDPNNAWAWARWGWTGVYRAQPQQALERFEKAMKLSPLDPFAFNTRMGMASALACSGRPADAVAIARDVTKRHPDVTWANRQLAAWAGMAGDLETARSAARKLLAANPDFTIRRYLAIPGFREMGEYFDRMVQGLRAAGLPET
ncbi:MAG TPA: BTAD domain-containing putative transcriptional regulator [Xanthobacteraceae bacterium]|jgi:TolB-like protein